MHQHTSKRREVAFRFFTYGVMSVTVITISIICILLVLGYRFNQGSGRVEQQALLQFRSLPADAKVALDGTDLGLETPEKTTVTAGRHTVRFSKQGYRDWTRTFTVDSGNLLWLNYARLVPTSPSTEQVTDFSSLSDMLASPDRRWIALQSDAKAPTLTLADTRDEKKPVLSELSLPTDVYAPQPEATFELTEWDIGSRFMLIKHKAGDTTEYLRVDRTDPKATVNISQQFRIGIQKAHFVGSDGNTLFVLNDGDIRKIDLQAGTISRPLVSKVNSFMLYKNDTIAFTAQRESERVAGVYKDGKTEMIVRRFADDQRPLHVAISNYFNDDYLAIAYGSKVEIVKDPYEANRASQHFGDFTFAVDVQSLQFSANGRFVLAQQGNQFTTYDLETDMTFNSKLGGATIANRQLSWLDDYYLWTDKDSSLFITEFDGSNQHTITSVAPGYDAMLSENGKRLFTIGRNEATKRFVLQSTKLVLE